MDVSTTCIQIFANYLNLKLQGFNVSTILEERINDWDPNLEARPPHAMEIIEATKNERVADQHGILQFSETESDEPGNFERGKDDGWIVRCLRFLDMNMIYMYDIICIRIHIHCSIW